MSLISKILYNLPESSLKTKLLDWQLGKFIQETDSLVSPGARGNIIAVKPPLWDKLLQLAQKL